MFKKYTSIENSYRKEFLERIKGHNLWDETFVIQEKVHGSNLSYWTRDGINFSAAKRTSGLAADEKFYNHQLVLETHLSKFQSIYTSIKEVLPEVEQVTIFGEIIGGSYPHKDVVRNNSAIKVQKGIFYSPNNEFFAFDLQINCSIYLDLDFTNKLFEEHKMLYARTLFKGSIEECLNYTNLFESTIPAELGLPEIEPNICEGVIIKPIKVSHFNNGVRVILKNKNEKWSENSKDIRSIKKNAPISEKVAELQKIIQSYVTENRLTNVLSKIGEVTMKDFGKIIGDLNRDAIEDFTKDYNDDFGKLEKQEQKLVTKSIVKLSASLIKAEFKK